MLKIQSSLDAISSPTVSNLKAKPLVYVITAIAIAILCVTFVWRSYVSLKERVKASTPDQSQKTTVSFPQLVENSKAFEQRVAFPTKANRIETFATTEARQKEVEEHAAGTRPVLPGRIWSMIPKFLDFKREHGSEKEKALYRDMTPTEWVNRWIKKRPLMFMTKVDQYILRDGTDGSGGFDRIGTDTENPNLNIQEYQSYFEMSLSAFLMMFVPTHFINDGSRNNRGTPMSEGSFEEKGIYVGAAGARFERPGLMECASMMVTPTQNTAANGYGLQADPANPKTIEKRLWAELYESKNGETYALPSFKEAEADTTGRFLPINGGYFDIYVYKKRMELTVEAFLKEADARAKVAGKPAYLHIVGLGLGVWQIHQNQKNLMLDVYAEVMRKHRFKHISDINFSWFNATSCGGVKNQETIDSQEHSIKVHFSQRNPTEKLTGEDAEKLLFAQYAWDSNSYPGNEYWAKMLAASGDPAAACCSFIPELQNPEINPFVDAKHLVVVSATDTGN